MEYYNIFYKNERINKRLMTQDELNILGTKNGVVFNKQHIPNNKLRVVKVTVL